LVNVSSECAYLDNFHRRLFNVFDADFKAPFFSIFVVESFRAAQLKPRVTNKEE
jgi:hypothetical protein